MLIFVSFVFLALVVYGMHLAWVAGVKLATTNQRAAYGLLAAALALVFATMPGAPAAAQSIDFDLQPFFDSLNQYLPVFLGVFGIIGGIAAAIAFARFIIGAVVNALSGKGNI